MSSQGISQGLVERLYRQANAVRWHLSVDLFAEALEASATRAFGDRQPNSRDLERYLSSLHLEDLALGCACAAGDEAAWDHFIREHRPVLYRAADALDPAGGVRELADSLYADLYGLQSRSGERQSLLRYFHGRSSLATWLRAVLAQRHVDRVRAGRRTESLPEEDSAVLAAQWEPPDPDRAHYQTLIREALGLAVSTLDARDRLRLACYYAQGLTLAQTGRLLREHEATVSRQLARTRRAICQDVEHQLRAAGLSDVQIARCFECVLEDSGPIDVGEVLQTDVERDQRRVSRPAATERTCKNAEPDRS
jgi:RNA polymerase sigma-70 factor